MKQSILKYSLLIAAMIISSSLMAQKDVRKNVRSGNKAYKQEKYSEAFDFYNKAIETNSLSPEANYNAANTEYRQKNWEQAVEHYNNYLAIEKNNTDKMSAAWHNIGNTMLQAKDLEKSMEAFKMALRLNPGDDEARYNLAVVQKMIQDQENDEQPEQQEQEQKQNEDQQEQQNNPDQPKKTEQSQEPEQMSRDNARQLLQAIEQDEKETLDKVNKMKAEERKQKSEENRKQSKDW